MPLCMSKDISIISSIMRKVNSFFQKNYFFKTDEKRKKKYGKSCVICLQIGGLAFLMFKITKNNILQL